MYIDTHVHFRDGVEAYKETIAHGLSVAERAGFTAVFDIPNLNTNPVISRQQAVERLTLALHAKSPVLYGLYILLTSNPNQIKEAVATYREFEYRSSRALENRDRAFVAGLKEFCGCQSVGPTSVKGKKERQWVNQVLSDEGYDGVVVKHCEDETCFVQEGWNPQHPVTHTYVRLSLAEEQCISDELADCIDAKLPGTVHFTHVSLPTSVDMIAKARASLKATCGVTPHHLLFDRERMEGADGLLYKMNPPLRAVGVPAIMLQYLREGKIDWVETDHAPHTLDEKLKPPYLSGIPGLAFYPRFIEWLKDRGFPEKRIREITFDRANEVFGLNLQPRKVEVDPGIWKELAGEYPFNPYQEF